MVSAAAPVHVGQLELRHRALALQRRRFWRELSYGAILVVADVVTLAAIFSLLGMLSLDSLIPGMGEGGDAFVRGLIPRSPVALGRRVTSLLFCLFVTRCYAHTERKQFPARTVIVGPSDDVQLLTQQSADRPNRPPSPTFVLSDTWPQGTTESMRELYEVLADSDADTIILVGALSDTALQAVMIAASSAGASVYATRRSAFRGLDEPSFVLRRAEPLSLLSRPALVGSQLVLKRTVDVTGAILVLVVLSPALLLMALAVRLTSRGPVFFRQIRVGLGGDPFVMLKFRTMVHDAELRQAALQESNVYSEDPLFKLANDPRTTPIGVFLRRSSLDELPQLINVLRGEMSLVGPRPALPSEVSRYKQHHFVRFEVLPGITGPWQVSGRNAIRSFEDVVGLEAGYIRGWTVWKDFGILLRTLPAVLSMKGAF